MGATASTLGGTLTRTGTASGTVLLEGEGDPKKEADFLLAHLPKVQTQIGGYGDGHPQSGVVAIQYAQACNQCARGCLSQGALRTANKLLTTALHILKLHRSVLHFVEQHRCLAETFNNLGCLHTKREKFEEGLQWLHRALALEQELEWQTSHATTLINLCSSLSLLDRHAEALTFAQRAVDMLASAPGWERTAQDPDSEAGDLLPVVFSNLALELEFTGDGEQANSAYAYALDLARARWGDADDRTRAIKSSADEATRGVELSRFLPRELVPRAPLSSAQTRKMPARGSKGVGLGKAPQRAIKLAPMYSAPPLPIGRPEDCRPGFHSPRFWSSNEGMNPRGATAFSKTAYQKGLEMARSGQLHQIESSLQREPWGEVRLKWRDLPECDMSRITGTVTSKSRLFSDVASNNRLNSIANILYARKEFDARYPKNLAVFKRAARERAASVEPGMLRRLPNF